MHEVKKLLALLVFVTTLFFLGSCSTGSQNGVSSGSGSGSSGTNTGPGGTAGTSGPPRFLFFTTGANPAVAQIDQNGAPGSATNIANPDPGRGMASVAAVPAGTFLYISEYGGQTATGAGQWFVAEFSVGSSGSLTHKATVSIPNQGREAIDPSGSLIAFAGNVMTSFENGHPNVALYKIASDGSLTAGGAPVELFGFLVQDLAFDASGQFLYVLTNQSNPATPGSSLQFLRVDKSSASLTLVQSIPLTIDTNAIAVGSKYVYAALANEIAGYAIQSDGSLQPITGTPFGVGVGTYGLAANPAGTMVYASDISKNDIAWFTVGSDGTLTLAGSTSPGSFTPDAGTSLVVDRGNHFLYGIACKPGAPPPGCQYEFWGGTIGSNGGITPMPGAPFPIQPHGYDLVY